jgi:glutamate synthase (NADPH/NADH) large chain/glutamate synthase (ferredoxin)
VVVAAILGADEYGFSTAPLIALGCVMMRVCHLNTCPVGVATQDPELRARFDGQPEHVVNYLFMVAEEARRIMSRLGVRSIEELIGRTELLETEDAADHWKAQGIDLAPLLSVPDNVAPDAPRRCVRRPDPVLYDSIDVDLLQLCRPAIEDGRPVRLEHRIENKNRAVGGLLSGEIARVHGEHGLPDGSIEVRLTGSAGQSFGAWLARGVELLLDGDANDYCGKGLSGGTIVVRPPADSTFAAEHNVIVGNTVLYGATSGRAFFRGLAGERFAVRNSGAITVVEGVGDHGCEYMTGGRVVVLGPTGLNFAAGMSGGIAYVHDADGGFRGRCNTELVGFDAIAPDESEELRGWVEEHRQRTGSPVAALLLDDWHATLNKIVKVMPHDYKRALAEQLAAEGEAEVAAAAAGPSATPGYAAGGAI